tara:strand:- start:4780 stop:5037 length:258 start_codon:yes stop_codon:yes gene_type:complete
MDLEKKTDLDKKTGVTIAHYDHDENKIQCWGFQSSVRLALLVNTIVSEKIKIDLGDEKQMEQSLQYINWDLKKFLKTPYTPEENA